MPNVSINIGVKIRSARLDLGLTQDQLADFAGLSVRSLRDIESGVGNPTIGQLTKILEVLGLELEIKTIN